MSEISWEAVKSTIHLAVEEILTDAKNGHYNVNQVEPSPGPIPESGEQGAVNPYGSASGIPATDNPYLAPVVTVPITGPVGASSVEDSPESQGLKVVQAALTQQGKRYFMGGTGPDVWDCSGLTQWAYKTALGISLPRTTYDQIKMGREVKFSEAIDGDLIFSNFSSPGRPEHVSINMTGPDNVVEAGDPVGVYAWGNRGSVVVKRYT